MGLTMKCPNCGLENASGAKFCANCGTALGGIPYPAPDPYQNQPQFRPQGAMPGSGNSLAKNIGIGCLIAVVIFLLLGLSCTRACFRVGRINSHSRYY